MLDVLLEALIDSLKLLPILILMYVLIEFIELKTANKFKQSKFLKGKYSTVVGASVGLIPQCGFSVIATDLYTRRSISVGTLLAIYISTSDEAIPILLSNTTVALDLLPILLIKFLLAIIVGYTANFILKYVYKPKQVNYTKTKRIVATCDDMKVPVQQQACGKAYLVTEVNMDDTCHDKGCCGHTIENEDEEKITFGKFIVHPLLHSLKIFIFILIVNVVLGVLIYYITEDAITNFLMANKYLQPVLAGLVGLIPNCASSVVISQLYAMGGLTLGGCVAGLSVNAGIGLAVLIKQNKDRRATVGIISTLYLVAVLTGFLLTLII